MHKCEPFKVFWAKFREQSPEARQKYFASLSKEDRLTLVKSFFDNKWTELIAHNIIDQKLEQIKTTHGLDLIGMRVQALYLNKVFLVNKDTWDGIEDSLMEFQDFYDSNLIFGGLVVSSWGIKNQFYKIRRKSRNE